MRNHFYYCVIIFLFSCTHSDKIKDAVPQLFPNPKIVSLNTSEGYQINSITGDTIEVLINSYGDTIQTGIDIPYQETMINRDSFLAPLVFKVGDPIVSNAHANNYLISELSNTIFVDELKLKKVSVKNNDSDIVLINSTGDTVKTGVPLALIGKKVECLFSKPVVALAPRMKDNAVSNIQYFDIDQGMNSSFVRSVLEDKNGNKWFTTSGGGVSKFDGETFTHFTEKEGLSSNVVYSILEDSKGNIWFGTVGGGLCKYDGKSFTHFTEREGLSHNDVMSILEDKEGNIWFGMYGGGVGKYDGEFFTFFTQKEGMSNNLVMSVYQDASGLFWFGTWGGGVCRFDGETFTHIKLGRGPEKDGVYSILEESNGKIWFGTSGEGAVCYHNESLTYVTSIEGLSGDDVFSIMKDNNGMMWFGTNGGASKFDGKSITHFSENEGISNNYVMDILQDKSGMMWFATEGGGVSFYDPASFTHFTEATGLNNHYVLGITEDKNKNVWFGTWGNGVNVYNGKTMTQYTETEGLSSNVIWSIFEDKKGNIWMGTYGGGVTCYDGESFTHLTIYQGLSDNYVFTIIEDKDGNIWFGTWKGGVTKYTPSKSGKISEGTLSHFTEKEGLGSNDVRSIIEDKNGSIWIATSGAGVSCYNGSTIKHYTEKEGLSHNSVWDVIEDTDGNIWFGTYGGGVSCFDGKSFTTYSDKEGLSDNYVMSIIQDKSGKIFVGTAKGLNCLTKSEKTKSDTLTSERYQVTQYNYEDGLKALDFFFASSYIDSENRIWWGTGRALETLDLDEFGLSENVPTPFLKRLDVNDYFMDYRLLKDSLKEFIAYDSVESFENYPLNPQFDFSYNHLTFHYSAIDWAAPHKIRYSYRMPELGESWSQPTEKTFADYRNLHHGEFTFQVCAIGESQIWSKPYEYKFTILPPWYHTWWARTLYVILSLLTLVLIVRWRTAKLKQRQKELETEVENATQEIRHQKEAVEQQKELIEEVHKEITDSINYAERLQRSLMASKKMLDENLQDYFVYFNPKEAVSGDFYWASKLKNGNFVLVCADSTGHGVPGAIMSMMNMNSLKEAVKDGHTSSDEILNQTRKTIIETLANDGSSEGGKDGMDAALLIFNQEKNKLEFTIANNPLWLLRNNELIEYKPDKMPVGRHDRQDVPFSKNTIDLLKGDIIYIFTDGYADQFGGEKGKKFKYSALKDLFASIHNKSANEQKEILKNTFNDWRKNLEQVDDVCVIGVRI